MNARWGRDVWWCGYTAAAVLVRGAINKQQSLKRNSLTPGVKKGQKGAKKRNYCTFSSEKT